MASGSYKGAGIKVPDLLLYAGLAVGAYYVYKMVVKPTSDVTGAVGEGFQATENAYSSLLNTQTKNFDSLSNLFQGVVGRVNQAVVEPTKVSVQTAMIPQSKSNNTSSISSSALNLTSLGSKQAPSYMQNPKNPLNVGFSPSTSSKVGTYQTLDYSLLKNAIPLLKK
ncbi:MAG: hypothetical protein HGB12_12510 [Bacteroidetes bacterium]|nr:hypothetical protein [Bacteroidota bacterium]